MRCTVCSGSTRVLESRRAGGGAAVRRRRECRSCGRRFTTFERVEAEPVLVAKRDGSRQPFDRKKLRRALARAAHKRPVASTQIETLVDRIADEASREDGEIPGERIGRLCLEGLRDLDAGAYLQFAGVDLADPDAIRSELARLSGDGPGTAGGKPANREVAAAGFRPKRVGSSAVTPRNQREESE